MNDQIDMKQDLVQALKSTCMLADITIRVWTGIVTDEDVGNDVKARHNITAENAGKWRKPLMADEGGKLKRLTSQLNAARATHYKLTAPFTTANGAEAKRGPRLIPKVKFNDYLLAMNKHKQAAQVLAKEFVADYPDAIERAKASLGDTAKDADYPSAEEVARKFDLRYTFMPIPTGSDFTNLPERALVLLSENMDNRVKAMHDVAMNDVWQRTQKAVEHMVERLTGLDEKTGKPKRFHNTLITNLKEAVDLLADLDVEQDPKRQEAIRRIRESLVSRDGKELKTDETVRQSVRANAEAILKNMDGLV